jgi:hypothetical protein
MRAHGGRDGLQIGGTLRDMPFVSLLSGGARQSGVLGGRFGDREERDARLRGAGEGDGVGDGGGRKSRAIQRDKNMAIHD